MWPGEVEVPDAAVLRFEVGGDENREITGVLSDTPTCNSCLLLHFRRPVSPRRVPSRPITPMSNEETKTFRPTLKTTHGSARGLVIVPHAGLL